MDFQRWFPGDEGSSGAAVVRAGGSVLGAPAASRWDHGEGLLEMLRWSQHQARSAEASMWTYALVLLDRREAEAAAAQESVQGRQVARKATVRQIARVLGQPERSTAAGLNAAEFARDHLPRLWEGLRVGEVDFARVRRVAQTAVRLDDARSGVEAAELVARLDAEAAEHGATKTLGELGAWVNRRVATLDAQAHAQLCQRNQADRWVRVEHHEDGTSLLEARIPTLAAAAIGKRLAAAARGVDRPNNPVSGTSDGHSTSSAEPPADDGAGDSSVGHSAGGGDSRTLAQREADLFCAWLQDGRVYQAPEAAKICVMIPEQTLTGESEAPGMSADRSWMIPAAEARSLAGNGEAHRWYTATTVPKLVPSPSGPNGLGDVEEGPKLEEHDVDVLSVVHHGYTPPARLREAVVFRDGVCQAPGCTVPAERCDIDHRVPYHRGGITAGANLQALCRSHHRLKSSGYQLGSAPRNPAPRNPAPRNPALTTPSRFEHPQAHRMPPRTCDPDEEHRFLFA